jgi:hypothetical protein
LYLKGTSEINENIKELSLSTHSLARLPATTGLCFYKIAELIRREDFTTN